MRQSISNWKHEVNKLKAETGNTQNREIISEEPEQYDLQIKKKNSNNQKNKNIDYMGLLNDIEKDEYHAKKPTQSQPKIIAEKSKVNKNNRAERNQEELKKNTKSTNNKNDFCPKPIPIDEYYKLLDEKFKDCNGDDDKITFGKLYKMDFKWDDVKDQFINDDGDDQQKRSSLK
jgi:hypothetical protein